MRYAFGSGMQKWYTTLQVRFPKSTSPSLIFTLDLQIFVFMELERDYLQSKNYVISMSDWKLCSYNATLPLLARSHWYWNQLALNEFGSLILKLMLAYNCKTSSILFTWFKFAIACSAVVLYCRCTQILASQMTLNNFVRKVVVALTMFLKQFKTISHSLRS